MKTSVLVLFFLVTLSPAFSQSAIKVPLSKTSVLIDGKFSENEWKDAYVIPVNASLNLYFKQDAENLFWCLRDLQKEPVLMGLDFYISTQNALVNLHASAKLGERKLVNGNYGDWNWWNNEAWTANVARFNSFTNKRFLTDEAKEFQLRKARFSDKTVRLMFQEDKGPNSANPPFPAGSSPNDTEKWLVLNL